jgi:hypothetical protein
MGRGKPPNALKGKEVEEEEEEDDDDNGWSVCMYVTKLLIMQFSPASRHLTTLFSNTIHVLLSIFIFMYVHLHTANN